MLTQYGAETAADTQETPSLGVWQQSWKNSTRDGQFCLFYQKHEQWTMKRAAATRTTESVFPCNRWVRSRNVQLCIDLSRR